MKNTIIYGVVITLCVLLAYFSPAWLNGAFTYGDMMTYYSDPTNLAHAQTMAFTGLALAELFHMLGMSNPNRSFINVFKGKNWMMLIGFALQLFVVNVPGVQDIFSTVNLEITEWLILGALSLIPLVVHESIVFINWIRRKRK